MRRFTFRMGLRFLCQTTGQAWSIAKQTVTNKFVLEDEDGKTIVLEKATLQERWFTREWIVDETCLAECSNIFYTTTPRDLRALRKEQRPATVRRLKYLLAVEKAFQNAGGSFVTTVAALNAPIAAAAIELGDESPPSASTLYRWWRKFRHSRCVTMLVDGREHAGRRRNATLFSLYQEAVAEVFLNKQKYPSAAVWDSVHSKVIRANRGVPADEQMPVPKRATIYRWLRDLNFELVTQARDGRKATQLELRAAMGILNVEQILERVEIDHTPLDILIIDEDTRLVLGRPWITLAIDRKSRCVMGFYISFHAPSAYSVLYCLRQAILPKKEILSKFPDIKGTWPCAGIPKTLVCDNGMDLHAGAVDKACLEMQIEVLFCGVAHPEMKGAIERLLGTINRGLIHCLPGTVFSNPGERGDYPSEDLAAIDLKTLVHLLLKWIVDLYHNTPHRGLNGYTPLQVWAAGEETRTIELPVYPQQLQTIIGGAATRTLFHYGLEHDSIRYNSPLLQGIKRKKGGTPELDLRFYEHDVSYIDVLDPDSKEFIQVPAVDKDYTHRLNRHVHRLIRAQVNRRFGADYPHESLLQAKAEMQVIVAKAVSAKKAGTRKKAAYIGLVDSNAVFADSDEFDASVDASISCVSASVDILPSTLEDDLPDLGSSQRDQQKEFA
jgi:putative transposase